MPLLTETSAFQLGKKTSTETSSTVSFTPYPYCKYHI